MSEPTSKARKLNMAPKLAFRNLVHDRLSLMVTLTGIVFSVVLVAVQCGLYIGSELTIAAPQDNVKADLWIVPLGTKSFDDASLLIGQEKYIALSTEGVQSVEELVVGFGQWHKPFPIGGSTAVVLIGSELGPNSLKPWSIKEGEGTVDDLRIPAAVAADESYFKDLGITKRGDRAEIFGSRVFVSTVTTGIRSFTTLPFIFMTLNHARSLLQAKQNQASYVLVNLKKGASVEDVQNDLKSRLPDREVFTHDQFRQRSLDYWLWETGAGLALITGAVLGLIVGVVIVAQTLYSSTKDHLAEFATLRALGAAGSYIHKVILLQALMSAILGFSFGFLLSLLVIWATKSTTLVIVMTTSLAFALFGVTVAMCAIAAVSAIVKVTRIDPAGVFNR